MSYHIDVKWVHPLHIVQDLVDRSSVIVVKEVLSKLINYYLFIYLFIYLLYSVGSGDDARLVEVNLGAGLEISLN